MTSYCRINNYEFPFRYWVDSYRKSKYLIFTAFLIMLGCGRNTEEKTNDWEKASVTKVFIDLKKKENTSFFKYYSDLEIIPLKTTDRSVIKEISKIVVNNNNYYILDSEQRSVLIFSRDGHFINRLDKTGKGPGEYIDIYDFDINEFTGNLEILDPRGIIYIYSPELTFINSLTIPVRAIHQFLAINRDTMVFYSIYEEESFLFFRRSDNIVFHKMLNVPDNLKEMPVSSLENRRIIKYQDEILFFQPYSNKVYKVTDFTEYSTHLAWDFGKYNFKYDKIKWDQPPNYYVNYAYRLSNEAFSFYYYFELESLVITRFILNQKWVNLYLNKLTGQYDVFTDFSENISPPIIKLIHEGRVITAIEFDQLNNYINNRIISPDQKIIIDSIKPDNNPILLIYKLKD